MTLLIAAWKEAVWDLFLLQRREHFGVYKSWVQIDFDSGRVAKIHWALMVKVEFHYL